MPPITGVNLFRVRKNDTLRAVFISNTAAVLTIRFRVLYDDGTDEAFIFDPQTGAADRSIQTAFAKNRARKDGWIVGGFVSIGAVATKRGQFYVVIDTTDGSDFTALCKGYVYDGHALSVGQFVEPGPGGGEGFLSWVTVFHDRAGNAAALDFDLFATNALRKVYGVAHYYHASNTVATRTVSGPQVHGLGGTKPTGFTLTGANAIYFDWVSSVVLTADQEGAFVLVSMDGRDGRAVRNDNGTMVTETTTTASTPFPLTITEADTDSIIRFPAISLGEATDTHSAYVLIEEWLVI